MKIKKRSLSWLIIPVLMSFGLLIGWTAGKWHLLFGFDKGNYVNLAYSPAETYRTLYEDINSNDPLRRINGYYSLASLNLGKSEFYKERLKVENDIAVKRCIIWALGESADVKESLKVLDEISAGLASELENTRRESIDRLTKRIERK